MKKVISMLLAAVMCAALVCGPALADKVRYIYDGSNTRRDNIRGTTLYFSVPYGWEEHGEIENKWNIGGYLHPSGGTYVITTFTAKMTSVFSKESIENLKLAINLGTLVFEDLGKYNFGSYKMQAVTTRDIAATGGWTRCLVFSGKKGFNNGKYWVPARLAVFISGNYLVVIDYIDANSMLTDTELTNSFNKLLDTVSNSRNNVYTPTPRPTKTPAPKPTKSPTPRPTNTPAPTATPLPTEIPVLVAPDGSWTCYRCGRVMKTNYCTHCGSARPTPIPTPTPTPSPTPSPTPVPTPEPWVCPECGEVNKDRYCGNCGTKNPNITGITVKEGDTVTFGRYPQTEAEDDLTPIEWIVLEVRDGKALLLSRYGLDAKPYNSSYTGITWETSTIRQWLNTDFLNISFTMQEQEDILLTDIDNSSAQGHGKWNTSGGNNTKDKVFLLSYAESNKYLNVTIGSKGNETALLVPSAYAKKAGAWIKKTEDNKDIGWWWLRSPGMYQNRTAGVSTAGNLYDNNCNLTSGCIRPAVWVNLDAMVN